MFKCNCDIPSTSQPCAQAQRVEDSSEDVIHIEERRPSPILISDSVEDVGTQTQCPGPGCKEACSQYEHTEHLPSHTQERRMLEEKEEERLEPEDGISPEPDLDNICLGIDSKDSMGACSADSSVGSDSAARAQYYYNKLLSTQQILQNKDETVRVQNESLSVAEGRIAALTARTSQMRRELDQQSKELQALRKSAESKANTEKTDVSISATSLELEDHQRVVRALQEHIAVIEELYRDCFYESARQEEMLWLWRTAPAHVTEINKCQDIAMEVETLKSEIREFLSSSNNDSGVWERSSECCPALGVGDDLRDIMAQLLRLREMLQGECNCVCDLAQEIKNIKNLNETLQSNVSELRSKVVEMDQALLDKEEREQELIDQLHQRELEFQKISKQCKMTCDRETSCDTLTRQLHKSRDLVEGKSSQLAQIQKRCEEQETTITHLQEQLSNTEKVLEENASIRSELREATRARDVALLINTQLEEAYRGMRVSARALRHQLQTAHARGAALSDAAARAQGAVRHALGNHQRKHTKQEYTIRQQAEIIRELRYRLGENQLDLQSPSVSETNHPSPSKCPSVRDISTETVGIWSKNISQERQTDGYNDCVREKNMCHKCQNTNETRTSRMEEDTQIGITSGSEIASCSYAPEPPRRLVPKKFLCVGSKNCHCPEKLKQERETRTGSGNEKYKRPNSLHRLEIRTQQESPPLDEVLERMELAQTALQAGQRRWTSKRPNER